MKLKFARALFATVALAAIAGSAAIYVSGRGASQSASDMAYGPFGPEGRRLREQLWILPSGDENLSLRATVFRPASGSSGASIVTPASPHANAAAPVPLVIINHGTDELTRESVSMPVYYWLSRWFVERGYAVVVPQRRGHGATGGELAEAIDSCEQPEHERAGNVAADDIEAALRYMRARPFVDPDRVFVLGVSSGGWASLALAARNPAGVRGILNFAGGRGARAFGNIGDICGADQLIESAGNLGGKARVPTLWLYAANDTYFGSDLARAMASAWTGHGGDAEFHLLPAYGSDGHTLADDRASWRLWGETVEQFLEKHNLVTTTTADANGATQTH